MKQKKLLLLATLMCSFAFGLSSCGDDKIDDLKPDVPDYPWLHPDVDEIDEATGALVVKPSVRDSSVLVGRKMNFSITSQTDNTASVIFDITDPDAEFNRGQFSGKLEIPALIKYNDEIYTVTAIGRVAFYKFDGMTEVVIPNTVVSIGDNAFEGTNLMFLEIPNSVVEIGNSAFAKDYSLQTLKIGNGVKTIGNKAFADSPNLKTVEIGNAVETIGNEAFAECTKMTAITLPNSLQTIGNSAFSKCSALTNLDLGNSVTKIGKDAFTNCSALTALTIPNSVTEIGASAFAECTALTAATIGNSVKTIGQQAFFHCAAMKSLVIGLSVQKFGYEALDYCSALTDITSLNPTPPKFTQENLKGYDKLEAITVRVPKDAINDYMKASIWRNFPNIVGL